MPSSWPRRSGCSSTSQIDGLVIGFAALVALRQRAGLRLRAGAAKLADRSRLGDQRGLVAARQRRADGCAPAWSIAQVAVSLLLLIGAGLVTRSLEAARRANPGFDADHVTAIAIDVQAERLRRGARPRLLSPPARRGARRAGHRVGHARLVDAAGLLGTRAQRVSIDGYVRRGATRISSFASNIVGPDYFQHAADPGRWPDATSRIATTSRRAGGDRQPHARAAILGRRGQRGRQAGPRRRRRLANGDRRRRRM